MFLDAGRFKHRVRFERQLAGADDGYGNEVAGAWTTVGTVWAAFRPKYGRESYEADALEATFQGVLTVRQNTKTKSVTEANRVVFLNAPYANRECQIRSIVPMPDNREIEIVIEAGVAT